MEHPTGEQEPPPEAPWTAESSRSFLGYLHGACSAQEFREQVGAVLARNPGAERQGCLGELFMSACSPVAEGFRFPPGHSGIQAAIFTIWSTREDLEVHAMAEAVEALLALPRGCIFLMDWVEDPVEQPPARELNVHTIQDLVWELIKAAELREHTLAHRAIEVIWRDNADAIGWAAAGRHHRYLLPILKEWGLHSGDIAALAAAPASLHKLSEALQPFIGVAEVNGLVWRFEKAEGMAPGTLLVKPAETGGSLYTRMTPQNMEQYITRVLSWERMRVDLAYDEDAEGIVIPPQEPEPGPAPVLLYMLGMGHFNSRQRFLEGDTLDLLQHDVIRKQFFVVVPKPDCRTGIAYFKGRRFEKDWREEAVWYYFTEILRKLGPEKVDPARLYISGISQGGAGVWHMCLKYGSYFAAAMPSGGAAEWPGDSWPRGSEPDPKGLAQLRKVPFRAVHVDCDNHAPPPKKDIEYLTYGLEERQTAVQIFGMDMKKKFDVTIRKWMWEDENDAYIELWWVHGPLDDGHGQGAWKDDRHLVWIRQFANWYWGVHFFFLSHKVPSERQWKFDDPPAQLNTAEHKANLDRWGYFDPLEKDIYTLRQEADVEELVKAFRKDALEAVRSARAGQEVPVTVQFGRAQKIERKEFRVVDSRPWDKVGVMYLKPYVNTVLNLKMCAAEHIRKDIQKFNTFGVGFRPPPQSGPPPPVLPLPLDTKLTEEHLNLDSCESQEPQQSPNAPEFTVWVLLQHHVDAQEDGYHMTTHTVKRDGMNVAAMKRVILPLLWEKSLVEKDELDTFGLCLATQSAAGPENKTPGCIPLAETTVLTVEHQLLQVCKPGLKLELIMDPISGLKKDYSVELGATVWVLRFMLADGKEDKARRMAVGLPPKKKTEQAVPLDDDTVLSRAHSKLHLWTIIAPKVPKAKS